MFKDKRSKHLPLTETVYYVLLALKEPLHGYHIMQRVEELSEGDVRLAAGTLYGAIQNLLKLGFIGPVSSDDPNRKVYVITEEGLNILQLDCKRMQKLIEITKAVIQ